MLTAKIKPTKVKKIKMTKIKYHISFKTTLKYAEISTLRLCRNFIEIFKKIVITEVILSTVISGEKSFLKFTVKI